MQKLKILVIDDDFFITEIVREIAEKMDCQVMCMHDGKDVGITILAYDPDLIFLDLVLPEIDGVEIIQSLAKVNCKADIILMSGLDKRTLTSVSEVAKKHRLNLIDAVTKPFAPGQVEGILQPFITKKFEHSNGDIKKSVTPNFGPRVLYEPEVPLNEVLLNTVWLRTNLVWQLNDESVVGVDNLLVDSARAEMSKGLTEIMLDAIERDLSTFSESDLDVGIILSIKDELIQDESAPDFFDRLVKQTNLSKSALVLEISEKTLIGSTEKTFDILSRLKIKGFRLAICVKDAVDQILNLLNKIPIDVLVIDMSGEIFRSGKIDDSESEFQIGSLVSYATGLHLNTSAKNVFSNKQFSFARKCKLSRASGKSVASPMDSNSIIEFYAKYDLVDELEAASM